MKANLQDSAKHDLQDTLLVAGVLTLEIGVGAIYWPAAFILFGVLALSAVALIERTKKQNNGSVKQ